MECRRLRGIESRERDTILAGPKSSTVRISVLSSVRLAKAPFLPALDSARRLAKSASYPDQANVRRSDERRATLQARQGLVVCGETSWRSVYSSPAHAALLLWVAVLFMIFHTQSIRRRE